MTKSTFSNFSKKWVLGQKFEIYEKAVIQFIFV